MHPRINAAYLEQFVNQTVRIVGRVSDVREDSAIVDAKGPIKLLLGRVGSPTRGGGGGASVRRSEEEEGEEGADGVSRMTV